MTSQARTYLFGGDLLWLPWEWTSSDDRVRGGSSYSVLRTSPLSDYALFHGNLDIQTLGGAGFASQRTTGEARSPWDLTKFDGLEVDVLRSDGKQYTFILKDELLPKSPNGREQSTVSWEYDFKLEGDDGKGKVFIKWDDLKPTYRGREKKDARPLDLKDIKSFSLMMRSFFGTQEGEFSLSIASIAAVSKASSSFEPYRDCPGEKSEPMHEKNNPAQQHEGHQGWLSWLFSFCV